MNRRAIDAQGHRWPVTGTTCTVCNLPSDPSLDGEPHPHCTPARILDRVEMATALRLLRDELGAEVAHPMDIWRVSGEPVLTLSPVVSAPPRTEAA